VTVVRALSDTAAVSETLATNDPGPVNGQVTVALAQLS